MLRFANRSLEKELLDGTDIPFTDIKQNLVELNFINTYLGGHEITLDGLKFFLQGHVDILHVVEIGCGGGDNLAVIDKFLRKKSISYKLTGIDIKQECVDFARQQYPSIEFVCSDYKDAQFVTKPSIIFNSLFCHHFNNEAIVDMISWMKENSSHGFFINDLQRHPMAYYAIKLLVNLFSKSYLVKHDAPLSVARSLNRNEWQWCLKEAALSEFIIRWKWAFRFLILYKK